MPSLDLAILALLAVTTTQPCAQPGPSTGWALPQFITGIRDTFAFWGPLGYGDEVHASDWIVSWKVQAPSAQLLRRRDAPCLVPGIVHSAVRLASFCDDLGHVDAIAGRYWLYPGRGGATFLEAYGDDARSTTLLQFDGNAWRTVEQVDVLRTLPLLSMPSGSPVLKQPAGLQTDERAIARDTAGTVLLDDANGSVFLIRPDGGRQRLGFPAPGVPTVRWLRVIDDAQPWNSHVVLTRRLAGGGVEVAVVAFPSGEMVLHETLQPPTDSSEWTRVIRCDDGSLVAVSDVLTDAGTPVFFHYRAVGTKDDFIHDVCITRDQE